MAWKPVLLENLSFQQCYGDPMFCVGFMQPPCRRGGGGGGGGGGVSGDPDKIYINS